MCFLLLISILNFRNAFFGGGIETSKLFVHIYVIMYVCSTDVLGGWREVMTICTYACYCMSSLYYTYIYINVRSYVCIHIQLHLQVYVSCFSLPLFLPSPLILVTIYIFFYNFFYFSSFPVINCVMWSSLIWAKSISTGVFLWGSCLCFMIDKLACPSHQNWVRKCIASPGASSSSKRKVECWPFENGH